MSTTDNLTISRILTLGAERQASDIHLSVGNQPVLRRGGKLEVLTGEAVLTPEILQQIVTTILTPDKQQVLVKQKSVTVAYNFSNRARYRVHVDFQKDVPAVDLRYIPLAVPKPEQLGLPKEFLELARHNQGLIIVSGPLGSGRTTAVASLLDSINHSAGKHLLTIEDPIEYLLVNDKSLIKQRDLGDDTPSLPQALDDVKVEDVDVIAVDVSVPPSAWPRLVNLAGAGILVIVIAGADSTVKALEALDMNMVPGIDKAGFQNLLAEVFLGATCQRLLPRVGGGLVLVSEILLGTQPVKALLRDSKILQLQSVLETSRDEGMISLERRLADLVKTGEVISAEAIGQASRPDALKSMLKVR